MSLYEKSSINYILDNHKTAKEAFYSLEHLKDQDYFSHLTSVIDKTESCLNRYLGKDVVNLVELCGVGLVGEL